MCQKLVNQRVLTGSHKPINLLRMGYPRLLVTAAGILFLQPVYGAQIPHTSAAPSELTTDSVPPQQGLTKTIIDETKALDAHTFRAVDTLLQEHQKLTGEQIIIALFKSLDQADPVERTQKAFSEWKIGTETQEENGVLLGIFLEDKKASFAIGYGLDSTLPENVPESIISDYIQPELQRGNIGNAVTLGTYLILEALNSPLILSGKAEEILEVNKINSPQATINAAQDSQSTLILIIIFAVGAVSVTGWVLFKKRDDIREWIQRRLPPSWQSQAFLEHTELDPHSNTISDSDIDSKRSEH